MMFIVQIDHNVQVEKFKLAFGLSAKPVLISVTFVK